MRDLISGCFFLFQGRKYLVFHFTRRFLGGVVVLNEGEETSNHELVPLASCRVQRRRRSCGRLGWCVCHVGRRWGAAGHPVVLLLHGGVGSGGRSSARARRRGLRAVVLCHRREEGHQGVGEAGLLLTPSQHRVQPNVSTTRATQQRGLRGRVHRTRGI